MLHLKDVIADQVVVDLVEHHEMVASDQETTMGEVNVDRAVDQEDSHAIAKSAIKLYRICTYKHTSIFGSILDLVLLIVWYAHRMNNLLSMPDQILQFCVTKIKNKK